MSCNFLQRVDEADFTIPVNIDDTIHNVFVIKRPGVDEFLTRMAVLYEVTDAINMHVSVMNVSWLYILHHSASMLIHCWIN